MKNRFTCCERARRVQYGSVFEAKKGNSGMLFHGVTRRSSVYRPKLLLLPISLCLAGVLSGCGSSSGNSSSGHLPPSPLQITTQSALPSGRVNVSYNTTFTATGGVPPYSWSASNVPPGLVMSTVGTLSGTPSQAGSFTLTASVSDSAQGTATGNFSITLAAPPTLALPSIRHLREMQRSIRPMTRRVRTRS
jgi:hypothetical protein